MSHHKGIAGFILVLVFGLPASGRSQTPDIQGCAPLPFDEAILALKDSHPETRSYAAESLAQLGSLASKAVPALVKVLKHDSADAVRAEAARALGRIGHEEGALPALRAALREQNLAIAVNAAEALCLLGTAHEAEGVQFLIQTLRKYRPNALAVPPECLFGALIQVGSRAREAGPVLLELLRDRRPAVCLGVLSALEAIEDEREPVVLALSAVVADRNAPAYLSPLSQTGEVLLLPLLTGRLDKTGTKLRDCFDSFQDVAQTNWLCRLSALRALAKIGPKAAAALPVLRECLKDRQLRAEASRTLEFIRGRSGEPRRKGAF